MTDIVERLRKGCGSDIPFWIYRERREAADEIERLRAVLEGRCRVITEGADRFEQMQDEIERLGNNLINEVAAKANLRDEIERLEAELKACHESLQKSGLKPPLPAMVRS